MNGLVYEFIESAKRKNYKQKTISDYFFILAGFLAFVAENFPDAKEITDISRSEILGYEKYLAAKTDRRGKIISRNRRIRYLSVVKMFFSHLEKEGKIFKNPAALMTIPKKKKSIVKDVLSFEEMESLIKSIRGASILDVRDRAILELLYSAGVRADELCNIRINDIDCREKLLYVRKGKYDSERIIPFGGPAVYWVLRYLDKARPLLRSEEPDILFVTCRGKQFTPISLYHVVQVRAREAGMEKHVTTHTFRHSCATHMLKGGADIRYVQKQLGHRDISTTERYLKIEITDLKEIHERCHPREREEWGFETK